MNLQSESSSTPRGISGGSSLGCQVLRYSHQTHEKRHAHLPPVDEEQVFRKTEKLADNFDSKPTFSSDDESVKDQSYEDNELPSTPIGDWVVKDESRGNAPHPSLEVPPLFFLLERSPSLLEGIKSFYRFRWNVSYPLQRRVLLSRYLRKVGIHLTWGEFLLLLPFLGLLVLGTLYSFAFPSVKWSGHFSRIPMIIAFVTATRNSIVTLLLGMPVERERLYHKLAGRIAFVNAFFHGYVCCSMDRPLHTSVMEYSFDGKVKISGSVLFISIGVIMLTSIPVIRRKVFELFYFVHILLAGGMVACAFYHTGITVPIL